MIAEIFLAEADARATHNGKVAFCHVVGLGLGVWGVHPAQGQIMVDAYATAASEMKLANIGDLNFSWFGDVVSCGGSTAKSGLRSAAGNTVRLYVRLVVFPCDSCACVCWVARQAGPCCKHIAKLSLAALRVCCGRTPPGLTTEHALSLGPTYQIIFDRE